MSSPNWVCIVGKGSDHHQLIKFQPSRAPGKGSVVGRTFLARLYYTASAQCLRLSERFFSLLLQLLTIEALLTTVPLCMCRTNVHCTGRKAT